MLSFFLFSKNKYTAWPNRDAPTMAADKTNNSKIANGPIKLLSASPKSMSPLSSNCETKKM